MSFFFIFQAEDGIRDKLVTGVQTCALPISRTPRPPATTTSTGDHHLHQRTPRPPATTTSTSERHAHRRAATDRIGQPVAGPLAVIPYLGDFSVHIAEEAPSQRIMTRRLSGRAGAPAWRPRFRPYRAGSRPPGGRRYSSRPRVGSLGPRGQDLGP